MWHFAYDWDNSLTVGRNDGDELDGAEASELTVSPEENGATPEPSRAETARAPAAIRPN